MWLKALALLVAAMMMPGTAMAQAEYATDPYGAQGDAGIDMRCYGDRYVVGVVGGFGTNIDRLRLQCALIGSDGNAQPTDQTSVSAGGSGGRPVIVTCSPLAYATSIWVELTRSKKQVRYLSAECKSAAGKGKGFFLSGAQASYTYFPGGAYIWYRNWECPANMAVTGLRVRYGQHINAIGIICNVIVRQPAPPPPVATTPTGPARPGRYVEYGAKNKSPTPRPTAPSFVGSYNLSSRSGRKMTLVVNQGDGNDVFGTLSSADAGFNGTFTGTVEVGGRKFTFTYRDPATGKTGSGSLKYINGEAKAVIGGITSDGPPAVSDIWGGPRQ